MNLSSFFNLVGQELDEEQLKRLCLEQLEQLSDATILSIISGNLY